MEVAPREGADSFLRRSSVVFPSKGAGFRDLPGMSASASSQPVVVGPALVPLGDYASTPPIALARPVIVVGSRNNCRIHLISSTVSKAHSLLVLTETGCYVADLASRTKTIVNGKAVREQDLHDGDTLQIGKFPFRFVAGRTRTTGRFPPAPGASLAVEDAPLPIPIERRVVLIGRRGTADIPLLEESVSTAHAVIFERDGKRYLRDLGSRTGTFINGRKIHQEELRGGDVIRIGETELRYQLDETPEVEEPEPTETAQRARVRPATPVVAPMVVQTVPEAPVAGDIEALAQPAPEAPVEPETEAGVDAVGEAPIAPTTQAPIEREGEAPAEREPMLAEPSASEPPAPMHDALADTAIPIAVDEHDEPAVIDLEPTEPASEVVEPVSSKPSETEPVVEPALERPAAPGEESVTEPVEELTPRRGWRGAFEPEPPAEQIVAEVLGQPTVDQPGAFVEPVEAAEASEAESPRAGEAPPAEKPSRRAFAPSAVEAPPTGELTSTESEAQIGESGARLEEQAGFAGETPTSEPLVPIDLPPLQFEDEAPVEPLARDQSQGPGEPSVAEERATRFEEPASIPEEPTSSSEEPASSAGSESVLNVDELPPAGSGLGSAEVEAIALAPESAASESATSELSAPMPSAEGIEIARLVRDDDQGQVAAMVEAIGPDEQEEPLADDKPSLTGGPVAETAAESSAAEIDLSAFTPVPVGETEEETEEPTELPRPLLSLDQPTDVSGTMALVEPPIEPPVETIEPPIASPVEQAEASVESTEPPVETIEPTAPEPELALPTVELLEDESSPMVVSEPLSDSAFARQVESFAGEGGEVVVAPEAVESEASEPAVIEQIEQVAVSALAGESTTPGDEGAETSPVALDDGLDSSAARDESVPTPLDTISTEDEALLAERQPVEPVTADVPPVEANELPPSASVDVFSWSSDQGGFLGGAPLTLPPIPAEELEDELAPAGQEETVLPPRESAEPVRFEEPIPRSSVSAEPSTIETAELRTPDLEGSEASKETPSIPPAVQEPPAGKEASPADRVESAASERGKLRGSQRRRRSLRRALEQESGSTVENAGAFASGTPIVPSSVDVFSQVPAVDADELLAGAFPGSLEPSAVEPPTVEPPTVEPPTVEPPTVEPTALESPAPESAVGPLDEAESTRPKARPRPLPRPVVPTFEQDPAGLAMTGRPISAAALDPDEQAAVARLAAARRRRLRLVPLLLVLMALLIGGTVWGIYHFVPVIGRVEVSVRFRNIDGLPNEARRREFREQQRQRLASLPVRQAAIANLAGYATPELQVPRGFLDDPVEYDRVASGAQWIERGDWVLRLSRRTDDLRGDSWRLRAMGDALQQSNQVLLDDARRLRSDVERLDADIARNSARRSELRRAIDAERNLGDSKRQLELALQKLESEISSLEDRWAEQSRLVTTLQAELVLLQTAPPSVPAPDAPVSGDDELVALQKQLDQVNEALQKSRAAGQQAAVEARQSFEAAVARFQSDLQDVQNTLEASPELKAYVESAQGLLEVTRRLTEDLIHRQQQHYDRLQAFKLRLEEQAQTRRAEQWQNDRVLRDLGEQLAYAQRQLNVATANGLEAEATDARLQIKLLEEKIARRQEELGADPLAVSAIMQLQEIIDFAAKAMAEDRARQEKVFEENTRILKQAAIARLPAEQQELARKLEARMAEINAARREFAAALSNETTQPAGDAEELARLQASASELAGRIEARRKQLAEANAARFTAQQEQKRQEQIRAKEAELASARLKVADLQEQLSAKHRDRRDAARRVSEASLAGERLAQRQQELEQIEQSLEVWKRTRDAKQSELGACVEPLSVSDLDIDLQEGRDQRWVYAASAGGGLFVLFGLLIGATIRGALHDIPVPELPMRTIPTASRRDRPTSVESVDKSDEDARAAMT